MGGDDGVLARRREVALEVVHRVFDDLGGVEVFLPEVPQGGAEGFVVSLRRAGAVLTPARLHRQTKTSQERFLVVQGALKLA